ncbi:MAG: hypothetical protein EAX91_01090 [Candidatus Lokiarchaeota archaeon]|nr:hypothetical protein [Candidatus Lokiarchaeota archaeon]
MVLAQLTPTRILTVYVAQGVISVVFLYLAIRILSRDRKRLNVFFASLYISPVIGVIANFIYAPLSDVTVVLALNFITNFTSTYAPIFIVVFDLILLKSEKIINTSKQLVILIGYAIAVFCMVIFLFFPGYGLTISPATNWTPVWSFPFFLYIILVLTCFAAIPAFYYSIKIYQKFEDKQLKKKWRFFIFGYIALMTFMYAIFISNFLNNATFRIIAGILALILAILGGFMMYYGVGRQIEK